MDKKAAENQLAVNVTIHYQGRIYNLTLKKVVSWLVPAAIVAYRLATYFHETGT